MSVALISQGKRKHLLLNTESGASRAGPPPLKDDREWIIVEGCSLSLSLSSVTSAECPHYGIWSECWADRPGPNLDLKSFSGSAVFVRAVQLSSSTKDLLLVDSPGVQCTRRKSRRW